MKELGKALAAAAVVMLAGAGGPALANDPGNGNSIDVCLSGGTGNPCNGNNGNGKGVGNVGDPAPVEVPDRYGRGTLVEQTGGGNKAVVRQSAVGDQAAAIQQIGDANQAEIEQADTGSAYAEAVQLGSGNTLRALQGGPAHNTLVARQTGDGNLLASAQYAAVQTNAAQLTQTGDFNEMSLLQSGGDNDALLTQSGDGNRMTLTQLGDANKATWSQEGSYIRDLQITQFGASTVNITQHNGRR